MSAAAPIIDAHAHLGFSSRFSVAGGDVADVLRLMQTLGVDMAVCAHQAELQGHRDQAHSEIMQAFELSGGRLLAYTVFNPWHEDSARWVEQRLEQGLPYVGIKIHPSFHQCSADDEPYRPAWELAASRHVPLLSHTWDRVAHNPSQALSFPTLFTGWLERFPQVAFIMGHSGGRPTGHLAAVQVARRFGNVHLDLAGDCYTWGLTEFLAAEAGAERVLFGSDFNWIDPRTHLGRIIAADISTDARQLILGDNAVRLFRLQVPTEDKEGSHGIHAED